MAASRLAPGDAGAVVESAGSWQWPSLPHPILFLGKGCSFAFSPPIFLPAKPGDILGPGGRDPKDNPRMTKFCSVMSNFEE